MASPERPHYFGKDLEAMSFARNYHKWILAEFLPYLGGSVAEVGAGVGTFSTLILETGVGRLKAFEPSPNMYPLLQRALGVVRRATAVNDVLDTRRTGERFDSIVYVNVLEHIEDDAAELENAYEALESTGHLLVFVPALSWLYSDVDRRVGHFRRYTKKTLTALAEQAGFTVVKARYFDVVGIIPWYVSFVLLRNQMGTSSVLWYDTLVVPWMRFVEGLVAPPVGKNLLLIAKKA